MKICHITTVHPPFDIRIFHKECTSLAAAGYETFLIAPHYSSEIKNGVTIIPVPKIKNRFARILFMPFIAFFKALKCRASVYHFHDPELLPVGVLLKIFTFKKIIYDVHEDYFAQTLSKEYIAKPFRIILSYLISGTEKFCILFFDGIISATDFINNKFKKHKNAICIHNYPLFNENAVLIQKNSQDIFTVVYAGSINKIRGMTQIIKAMEKIPDNKKVKLVLCGEFESEEYKNELQQMKGYEKAEYPGWVPPEKLKEIAAGANAGLVCFLPEPNHIDAMPNKIFEYMASSIPIIASDFPLWKKIVEENKSGICVNPENPDSIATGISFLYDNPEAAQQMGRNGIIAVKNSYNWGIESKRLIDFYKNLFC